MTSDFDTIRANLVAIVDLTAEADYVDVYDLAALAALSRIEAAAEQTEKALAEAVNYLKRVVQADRDDTKMGYPIPGDSCLAACIGLEVMPFLDGVGALTERSVADAMSSTSGGIPAQVGTDRSVSAPDTDCDHALIAGTSRCIKCGRIAALASPDTKEGT